MNTISVLISDEHPVALVGLDALLKAEPDMHIVAMTGDPAEMAAAFRKQRPDVALLDHCSHRTDTVRIVSALHKEFPETRFILFTDFDGEDDVLMALKSHINGYLAKTTAPAEILAAIRAVYQGKRWISPPLSLKIGKAVGDAILTGREREVLIEIARGKSNQEIAVALFIAEGTVKFHVNNILAKLKAADRTEAVVIGLTRGILRLSES